MDIQAIWQSVLALGEDYGVNPVVFAVIYIGAIPFFTVSLAWLVRNLRARKSPVLPGLLSGIFFISAYLYLMVSGRNVPWWVYAAVVALVVGGAVATIIKIRTQASAQGEPVDLLVIGGGAAGLTAAGIGAALGAKTVMVEKHRLGGDCTWTGCIPSKTLLHHAQRVQDWNDAVTQGVFHGTGTWDTAAFLRDVRKVREEVYNEADHPDKYKAMGIDVRFGAASFTDKNTVAVETPEGPELFRPGKIIIAAGSRAFVPPIPGLDAVPYLTNESIFELEKVPASLAVIGGGPIGLEMAQAFRRLGASVTVIEAAPRILPRDHEELALELHQALEKEGIVFRLSVAAEKVAGVSGKVSIHLKDGGVVEAEKLLVAVGRLPALDGLGLEKAGIKHDRRGIVVNNSCRTNVPHIYAIGDAAGRAAFTHMAEHMAKTASIAALLGAPMFLDEKSLPWATYTTPELAHVGATEEELKKRGKKYRVFRFPYGKIDRAETEGKTLGWIRLYTNGGGRILGADILGERAGDLIGEVAVAMKAKMPLSTLSSVIHPYPSYGLGVRRAADQWYIQKQSLGVVKAVQWIFGYSGPLPDISDPDRIV